ncbi:MAG: pilus assembly protein N-terminal domain-containing protein, partial [Acidobacteria bacterium]|nr:pilus assembly protein N-terminal domain-containing protein [Acidobacteriota bacterium]
MGGPEELHLMVGRSLVLTSPTRVKRVSIADPTVADALIVSPNQILINGKTPGAVSFVLWDEFDQNQTFDLLVELDVLDLAEKIRVTFPEEPIRVEPSRNTVILTGRASSEAVADKIFELAGAMAPNVISLMEVPLPPSKGEVLLEVRFAEVNRSAISQLGINFFRTADTIGSVSTQQFGAIQLEGSRLGGSGFRLSDLLNIFVFNSDIDVGATIRALQQKNML